MIKKIIAINKRYFSNKIILFSDIFKDEKNTNILKNNTNAVNKKINYNTIFKESIDIYYENIYNAILKDNDEISNFIDYLITYNYNNKFDEDYFKRIYYSIIEDNLGNIKNKVKIKIYIFYLLYNYLSKDKLLKLYKSISFKEITDASLETVFIKHFVNKEEIINNFLALITEDIIKNEYNYKIFWELINYIIRHNINIITNEVFKEIVKIHTIRLEDNEVLNMIIFLAKEIKISNYNQLKNIIGYELLNSDANYLITNNLHLINRNYMFFLNTNILININDIIANYNNNNNTLKLSNSNIIDIVYYQIYNTNNKEAYNLLDNLDLEESIYFEKMKVNYLKMMIKIIYKYNTDKIQSAITSLLKNEPIPKDNTEFNIEYNILHNLQKNIKKKISKNELTLETSIKLLKIIFLLTNIEDKNRSDYFLKYLKIVEFQFAYFISAYPLNNKELRSVLKLHLKIMSLYQIGSRKYKELINRYLNESPADERKELYSNYLKIKQTLINLDSKRNKNIKPQS